jgi:hypothetical protein
MRYSEYSNVTSCLEASRNAFCPASRAKTRDMFYPKAKKTCVTCFARPAHIANESCKTGCKADVKRADGDIATSCLPSRLSQVEPCLPLYSVNHLSTNLDKSLEDNQAVTEN